MKQANITIGGGLPIQITEESDETDLSDAVSSPEIVIARTLKAYQIAAVDLLAHKYSNQASLAPSYLRENCDIWVFLCRDGILVRYDLAQSNEPKARLAEVEWTLQEAVPQVSEQVIHLPADLNTYVFPANGPEIVLTKNTVDGNSDEISRGKIVMYLDPSQTRQVITPPPPAQPPPLIAVNNSFNLDLHGVLEPPDPVGRASSSTTDHFIARSDIRLAVGWEAIVIYPHVSLDHWNPDFAASWAELDILAAILRRNSADFHLSKIDSRGDERDKWAALFNEFEMLLAGPEEPAHQFLRAHPEILCPTHEKYWSKLAFGNHVSDFVFREAFEDYLLVEIEAPYRKLFRKDGQQLEQLTHAIDQTRDWIQYIEDHKQDVDSILKGISTNPRTLIVIGRSSSLTEVNRRKLATLQAQQNKLRIMTYDDLIASARANIEHILGPLGLQGQNVKVYYYK